MSGAIRLFFPGGIIPVFAFDLYRQSKIDQQADIFFGGGQIIHQAYFMVKLDFENGLQLYDKDILYEKVCPEVAHSLFLVVNL